MSLAQQKAQTSVSSFQCFDDREPLVNTLKEPSELKEVVIILLLVF